jgi:hypothetical protein
MNTSLISFRSELTEKLLDFIWRQWSQLGASGSSRDLPENWVIDPEVLLAFSSDIARHDARVFDEILDWMKQNGHWINTQRLSKIISRDHIGDAAVIGAIAEWMKKNDNDIKWSGIAMRKQPSAKQPPEPLFHSQQLSPIGKMDRDRHFVQYGLIRPTVELRGMSQTVDMRQSPNAVFTFRALFGIGIRADVILYMMTIESGHARLIADYLGYNHMRVQEIMHDLTAIGMLNVHESGRSKNYAIDRSRWWRVIMNDAPAPLWRNWRAFYRGISTIMKEVWAIDAERADDYIAFSIIRNALKGTRNDFYSFGAPSSIIIDPEDGDWQTLKTILYPLIPSTDSREGF